MKLFAFLLAIAAALLVARPLPPAVTMANQLIAIFGWGVLMLVAPAPALQRSTLRAAAPLLIVFAIAAVGCLGSILVGGMPSPPGNGVLGIILLAAAVTLHGTSVGASDPVAFFRPFAIALVVAGVGGAAIAVLEIFAPEHVDNVFIALSNAPGRASGNIGQANHLADSILWGLIGMVPLARAWRDDAPPARLARAAWVGAGLLMILGVVLTGSRMALVALVLMAAWGVFDRQLAKPLRIGLVASPVLALLILWPVTVWSFAQVHGMVMTDRGAGGVMAFRGDIWGNAVSLIKAQPWLGVGWGQFNFAWSLTPFTTREAGLVDNVHDLPLQLAVELGVPAAVVMMGLLAMALWKALRHVWRLPGEAGLGARATVMIVVVMGLHSLLEYPLWYAYMLLPTAWAFGVSLGTATRVAPAADAAAPHAAAAAVPPKPLRAWRVLGLMMVVLSASAWLDYLNIVSLFLPTPTSLPFDERIVRAQASPLYSNMADYVDITQHGATAQTLPMVQRTARVLVNSRLLYVWANVLQAQGETDKARYLAARMREFNLVGARDWFNVCSDPAVAAKPFQCLAPEHPVTWRDFR